MKLRIRGNSVRLRLTMSETQALAAGQTIVETCQISPVQSFAIELSPWNLEVFQVQLINSVLRVYAPENAIRVWASDNSEGIYGQQENGSATPLGIAVEKDYTCLTERPGEDEHDNFPNPETGERSC